MAAILKQARIGLPTDEIVAFCQRHQIQELALFGSVLRDDFRPDSDIDVLIEFEPEVAVGLFEFSGLRRELTDLLGREVDLVSHEKKPETVSEKRGLTDQGGDLCRRISSVSLTS